MTKWGLGVVFGSVLAVYLLRVRLSDALNDYARENTQTAGQALSDFMAKFNGWEPVELAPLMIRDFYLTGDKRLTPQAEQTLWAITDYQPYLKELFGKQGGQLKPKYEPLINVAITQLALQES